MFAGRKEVDNKPLDSVNTLYKQTLINAKIKLEIEVKNRADLEKSIKKTKGLIGM